MSIPVIAVFDIGKTNKKLLLFDESYNIVYERSVHLDETTDEDGDPCEDLPKLVEFVLTSLKEALPSTRFQLKAVNFSAYGASFVYIDDRGHPIFPLFNYLKKYPAALKQNFYSDYGGEHQVSLDTASPVLGSLNSGMQIYRLKYEKPQRFSHVKFALHLPQFLSFLISRKAYSELTSLGCHTHLWDFRKLSYHEWVRMEGIDKIFPPMISSDHVDSISVNGKALFCGVGIHDSSAALIPYLRFFDTPFVLISTGTWNISLNPFNSSPLTPEELGQDCLCYMSFTGKPVKASRLFAGYEYDVITKRLADHFDVSLDTVHSIDHNPSLAERFFKEGESFANVDLNTFATVEDAYFHFMTDLVRRQHASTMLVLKNTNVDRIFVDGGFSKNKVFMNLLSLFFPGKELYAASIPQGTALGAAMAIHDSWNRNPLPKELIRLVPYGADRSVEQDISNVN